jgi:hypothetical protein
MKYRMSETGDCLRVLSARRLGYTPLPRPDWQERVLRESQRHEQWVVDDLRENGYDVERAGTCQLCGDERYGIHVSISTPSVELVGHLDGRIRRNGRRSPLEIKALGRFTFQKFEREGFSAFPSYAAQQSCYMVAEGPATWPGLYVVKCRDTGKRIEMEVPEPPMPFGLILERLERVEQAVNEGRLLDGEYPRDSELCRWCQFRYLCAEAGEAPQGETIQLSSTDLADLAEAVRLWREGRELERQARERIESARDVFRTHVNVDRPLKVFGLVVSLVNKERRSYPEKLLREYVDENVLEKCLKVTPYEELRVREE